MIGLLRGVVAASTDDSILLDVNGVGYEVFVAQRLARGMGVEGTPLTLIIETHVREDHIHLYGFSDAGERACFRILTTVQGVGVKVGLAILSMFTPEQIVHIILSQDKRAFAAVSGVGPKLAERLVIELKNQIEKLRVAISTMPATASQHTIASVDAEPDAKPKRKSKTADAPAPSAAPSMKVTDEVVSALVNLGYARTEAYAAVSAVMQKPNPPTAVEALIPACLKEMAR